MLTPEQKREIELILDGMDDARAHSNDFLREMDDPVSVDDYVPHTHNKRHPCASCPWILGSDACEQKLNVTCARK